MVRNMARELGITELRWIYTECGHGKGPSDGFGAAIKKRMDGIMLDPFCPSYFAEEMAVAVRKTGPGYRVSTYTGERKCNQTEWA